MSKYLVKKVGEYTFKFKLDLNPLSNQYEPHIWHRHLIEPNDVIRAFFSITEENWNDKYQRYEAYSEPYNMTIYYMKQQNLKTIVIVITAFNDWR